MRTPGDSSDSRRTQEEGPRWTWPLFLNTPGGICNPGHPLPSDGAVLAEAEVQDRSQGLSQKPHEYGCPGATTLCGATLELPVTSAAHGRLLPFSTSRRVDLGTNAPGHCRARGTNSVLLRDAAAVTMSNSSFVGSRRELHKRMAAALREGSMRMCAL